MIKKISTYISTFSKEERAILENLRRIINSVSEFEETIVYGMPGFRYKGKIAASFRMHKNHLGFYPYSGTIIQNFSADLKKFKTSIGAVQLPKGKKLPEAVIKKIVRARMKEIDNP
jgi:uncharacterized protein YdhG (YjbR/CyaY superfamily)